MSFEVESSSFRDPSGMVFRKNGSIYRCISESYKNNFELLLNSGLYDKLLENKLLIPHEEVNEKIFKDIDCYKIIAPECVPFISYPYEWSFSQLKNAALTTLRIQNVALKHGMSLKDSSAYNIQFFRGKPILIDTLSFEKYREGKPWVGYKQFCQHFLAPLALMAYRDIRLGQLGMIFIDGVPLDLSSKLLPGRTKLKPSILNHIHLHALSQKALSDVDLSKKNVKVSKFGFKSIIYSLERAIVRLRCKSHKSKWSDYYNDSSYSKISFESKFSIVSNFIDLAAPETILDLGANIGVYSRVASKKNIYTLSVDSDHVAVENNYLKCLEEKDENILPLVVDLVNPSPGIGWECTERSSFLNRLPKDTVLALAFIHHLVIANNLSMDRLAKFFSVICEKLIIEFIPKNDSQVKRLLSSRKDIFQDYNESNFKLSFSNYFKILSKEVIKESDRTIYLLVKKR